MDECLHPRLVAVEPMAHSLVRLQDERLEIAEVVVDNRIDLAG
jgi:hypothetical protein